MADIIPIFIPHAGCPCQCVFCNQKAIASTLCAPSYEAVNQTIADALENAKGKPEIAFYGGSFTAIDVNYQVALLETAYQYIEKGKVSHIRLSTRPDCISEQVLERLQRYGVKIIELGAQSMDDDVLLASKRGHTSQDVMNASKLIKEYGFSLILQLMAGLPNDVTPIETAKKIADLKPDGVRIYPVAVLPNTELHALYKNGEYQALTIDKAISVCADMLSVFIENDIPVIRLGLNPSEELDSEVIAGAYHPAMGELCYGEVYYREIEKALAKLSPNTTTVEVFVHQSDISKAIGQKKRNIIKLNHTFPHLSIKIKPGDVPKYKPQILV